MLQSYKRKQLFFLPSTSSLTHTTVAVVPVALFAVIHSATTCIKVLNVSGTLLNCCS